MKLAIVFDDLIQFGGAERLLLATHEIWPDAPVYTSVVSKEWEKICKQHNIQVVTSYMQKLPLTEKLYKHYAPFLLYPIAFEGFDFSQYDVVLSMSSRFSHGVNTKPHTKHICYMNSPGRMIWEPFDYFETQGVLLHAKNFFLSMPLGLMRMWDYKSAQKIDHFIANSVTPHKRIKKYYKRHSEIIYPFVETNELSSESLGDSDYYLIISRLVSWKKIDHAIEACNRLNLNLKIIGSGPDLGRLKNLAGSSVEFLGYVSEEEKISLIKNSAGVIITQYEDFGIVPLEAMYYGVPVIAYAKGGVLETVIPGKTGEFYYEQHPDHLELVLKNFDKNNYDFNECRKQAEKYSKERFKKLLEEFVNGVYLKNKNCHVSSNAGANTV